MRHALPINEITAVTAMCLELHLDTGYAVWVTDGASHIVNIDGQQ